MGWEMIPFEQAINRVNYPKKIPRKQFLSIGKFPVISQECDFINGYWDNEADLFRVKQPVVIFGDHTKVVKLVDFDFVLGADGVKILEPIEELSARFLAYFLNSVQIKDLGYARHYRLLKELDIPLPSMEEQKRIVAVLDEAFADIDKARALTEQNLKNARELFESYLHQIFSKHSASWINSELFEHVKFIDYRGRTPVKTESGLKLITAKNVRMGYLRSEPEEYVAPESYDSWMTRGIPQKGDVLFTTEAPLANVAQLDTTDKVVFAQRIITMQPDRSLLNDSFLKYLLMSQPVQKRIHDKGTGATATGIKASLLKKIRINFPDSLNEQVTIVENLDTLSKYSETLTDIYTEKLYRLNVLRMSLLNNAFERKLSN